MRNRIKVTGVLVTNSGKSDSIKVYEPAKRSTKRSRPKVRDTKNIAIGGLSFIAYLLNGSKGKINLSELARVGNLKIDENLATKQIEEVSKEMEKEFNKGRVRVIGTATRTVRRGYTTQVTR